MKKVIVTQSKRLVENTLVISTGNLLLKSKDSMIEKLVESSNNTYNAKTGVIVNAYESGLLDPVKVTRVALENALSVASTILTSESVVFDEKREESPEMNMGF